MPTRYLGLLIVVCALCSCSAVQAGAGVLMGPYVNDVDCGSAKIVWVSEPGAAPGRLTVQDGSRRVETVPVRHTIEGRDEMLNVAALDGLAESTEYRYRLVAGEQVAEGSFRTAAGGAVPFTFVIYGDTRTYPERHRAVCEGIAAEDPAFVVCSGDLLANGEVWELWKREFFDPAMPYLSKSVLWPVRGNHEGDAVFYRELFDLPGNELYFSFDFGNAHFIVLDNYVGDERREMLDWLRADLAQNRADWTFVCYHEPTFNIGGHGSRWGERDFLPVLEEHGVDFVVTGHSHLYERFVPIGPAGKKPLIHVVSGGGGAPTYPAVPSPILAGGIGQSELHFCVFYLDGDRCEMVAKGPDGAVLDRLSLVKRAGTYQEEVLAAALDTQTARHMAFMFRGAEVDFAEVPAAGERVRARLVAGSIPDGSVVTLRQPSPDAAWKLDTQRVRIVDGGAEFQVRVPDELSVGLGGADPALELGLEVRDGARTYTAERITAQLSGRTISRYLPEPEPVAVSYLPEKVVLDGDLAEWAGVRPMPLPFLHRQDSSFRLCWREDGLYGAVRATDDSVEAAPEAPWGADCAEVFIEKDFARSLSRTDNTAQYAFSPAPGFGADRAGVMVAYDARADEAGIECAWAAADDGYVLEFFIPARTLAPARMQAGTMIGLNFALSDDGVPVEQFYSDKNDSSGWRTPITWGAVRLER